VLPAGKTRSEYPVRLLSLYVGILNAKFAIPPKSLTTQTTLWRRVVVSFNAMLEGPWRHVSVNRWHLVVVSRLRRVVMDC
jgi:hypothetical protein